MLLAFLITVIILQALSIFSYVFCFVRDKTFTMFDIIGVAFRAIVLVWAAIILGVGAY